MVGRLPRVQVALGLMLACPCVALADTAPAPAAPAPLDPDNLAIARQIVAIAFPQERASAIMGKVLDGVMVPMRKQMQSQLHTTDPGLIAIFDQFMKDATVSERDVIVQKFPEMTDATTHAYARMFSHDDLVQILAFARTPAGAHYLSRATEVLQDPDVQAYTARLVATVQGSLAPVAADFKARLMKYLAAHPDVMKAMAQTK